MKLKIDPFTFEAKCHYSYADAVDTDIMMAVALREMIRGYIDKATGIQEIDPEVKEVLNLLNKTLDEDRKVLRLAIVKLASIVETLWI